MKKFTNLIVETMSIIEKTLEDVLFDEDVKIEEINPEDDYVTHKTITYEMFWANILSHPEIYDIIATDITLCDRDKTRLLDYLHHKAEFCIKIGDFDSLR